MSLINEDILYIFNALKPHESRLVGGIVRDYLYDNTIADDIDIATQATPEESTILLDKAGLKVIPTGLKHGTVTAIYKDKPYEITTLRKDIETDGRHASVTFTKDFKEDALRRDFTFNALYMDSKGNIHDYFNGQEDLGNRHIRFIGNAEERINEDYLRILRYFRFRGKFKEAPKFDSETLNVIQAHTHKLTKLSKERITTEIVKTLNGKHIAAIFKTMHETKCLEHINLNEPDLIAFNNLNKFKENTTWTKLVCMYPNIDPNQTMLNLANKDKKAIKHLQNAIKHVDPQACLQKQAYTFGKEYTLQALQIRYAQTGDNKFTNAYIKLQTINTPVFEVQGKDLMQLGEEAGPTLGKHLKDLEQWWIEHKFPNKETCLQHFINNIQKNCR